ncbi:hypothetical protein [Calothrix sp. UHCC 0171]|uniref:hypothetical protein n=1 Tax=Calothrix sp. UHCC 0171 TaxID=3110245 RepID=UPI002B1F6849|nr:hypothetical protein [Calothrix sp. UHCC 0171]MEA5571257.1 hypothetical protein [Calothrix sp. UHCC 0171]
MFKLATFWKWLYSDWEASIDKPIPGYTILLPVPGDLPVFLKIALEICCQQKSDNLVETIVIPDQSLPGFKELLQEWAKDYSISPIRLVKPKLLEELIFSVKKNPHHNYASQVIRGINATQSTHALLHDADLFITNNTFLNIHYQKCNNSHLACLGVSPVWDNWYNEQGIYHLNATWELIFNIQWARSFKPWEHRGHDNEINGKAHTFDVTLFPQCKTDPKFIDRHQEEWGFVHFNYVICTYRWFQKSKVSFEDESFRILLIRLLINAFDTSAWKYDVPEVDELVKGINDASNCVTYMQQKTRENYGEFRSKLQTLIDSQILNDEKAEILSEGVRNFDRVFC